MRRQRLEQLATSWLPPLQLTPVTADIDEAREWFAVLPAAMGVEGLVAKGAASRYTPGRRDAWIKVNSVGSRCSTSSLAGHTTRSAMVRMELDGERHLSGTLRTAVCSYAAPVSFSCPGAR